MTPKIITHCDGKMKFDMPNTITNTTHSDELPNFFAPQKSAQYRHICRNDNSDSSDYEFTDSCHYNIRKELLQPNAHTQSPNTQEVIQEIKLSSNGDEAEFRQDLQSWDLSSRGSGVLPLELAQYQRSSQNDSSEFDSFENENEGNHQVEYQTKQHHKAYSISFLDQGLIMAKIDQREDQDQTVQTNGDLKTSYDGKSGIVALNLPRLPLNLPKFQRSSYQSERSSYRNELTCSHERLEEDITNTCIDTEHNNSVKIQRTSGGNNVNISNESTLVSSTSDAYKSVTTEELMKIIEEHRRRESKLDMDNRSISSRSAVSGVRYSGNEGGRYVELYKQGTHKLRIQAASQQSPPRQAPNPAASHANPTQLALYEKGVSKARSLRARMTDEKRELASKEAKRALPTTNACCDRLYNLSKSKQSSKQVKDVLGEKRVVIPTTNARCDRLYNLSKAKQEKQRQDRALLERNKKIVTPTANARCDRLYNLSKKKQLTGKMRRQQAFEKSQINTLLSSKYTQLAKSKSVGSRSDRVAPASKRRVATPAVNKRRIIPTIQKKIDSETKELAQLVQERIASKSISLDHKFEKHRAENGNDLFLEDTNDISREFVADFLRITSPTTNSGKKEGLGPRSGAAGVSTAADTLDQFLRIKIMQKTMNEKDDDSRQMNSCPLTSTDPSSAHSPPQSPLGNNSHEDIDSELKSKLKSLKTLAVETNSYTYIGTSTDEYYDNYYHSSDKNLAVRDPTDRRARDCYSQGIESRDCSSASVVSGDCGVGRTMPDDDGYYSASIDESFFPSSDGTQIIGVDPIGTNSWASPKRGCARSSKYDADQRTLHIKKSECLSLCW